MLNSLGRRHAVEGRGGHLRGRDDHDLQASAGLQHPRGVDDRDADTFRGAPHPVHAPPSLARPRIFSPIRRVERSH
eukprot:1049009-Prymnesium_polylepis.2